MSYLSQFLNGEKIQEIIKSSKKVLRKVDFNCIAVRGNSGMLIGAPLAMALSKNLILVRKPGETKHTSEVIEFCTDSLPKHPRVLIVDDFISSGNTINTILEALLTKVSDSEVVGIGLYRNLGSKECYLYENGKIPIFYLSS